MMKKMPLLLVVVALSAIASFGQPQPSGSKGSPPKAAGGTAKSAIVLPPEKTQPVRLPLFDKPPVIDGKLDDEVWKHAIVLKDFYQVQPGDNIAPSKPTEVMLGHDAKFLYIAFHCYDEPDKVRATIPKRDNIFNDDYVGILFDTFNDSRKAYEFNFSPLGVQADGIWTDGQGEDFNPDVVMESKGMLTGDGWTVEVAIPFKSLRYVAGKDKLWGAHFFRRIKRFNNELDSWMPLDRDKSSTLAQEGHLSGLEGISTERTLELIPSLTLSETGKRKGTLTPAQLNTGLLDPGRFVNEPIKFDPGLTGKFTITPNVTLDFAVNPDFAQVESDQLVVTANQRFPIFFAEKRPFFLEGVDIFNTQIAAVHTRAIVDPDVAIKLTGKVNRNTFGLLVASDNGPGNLSEDDRSFIVGNPFFLAGIEDPDPNHLTDSQKATLASIRQQQAQLARILEKNAQVGVLRLKHDIGKDSFIGFLGTYRKFVDQYNELGGFDSRLRINKQTTFSVQALFTHSRRNFFYPDLGQTLDRAENGFIYATDYNMNGRHFGYEYSTVGRTRYYRADVGFNRRTNTNNHNLFVRYNSEPHPKARLISWRVYDDISTNFDWQGRSQIFNNESQIQFSFPRQTYLGIGLDKGYERVFEEEFGMKRPAGSNCAMTNTCTFWGTDNERSASNGGLYVFAGSTLSKRINFNAFADQSYGNLDFDSGAGPRYPRVSIPAVTARKAQADGLCGGSSRPAICNAPRDPGPGKFFNMNASVTYQPSTPLNLTLSFTKQRLRRNDTHLLAFDENIVSMRGTYQFTRFIFARGRIDFDSIASNFKGQFLFGWTPNPGTALYIGYNDDINRNGFSPFTNQLEPGFRRNGRTFFIKMSYLFRKSF
ncbi:MAG TPA: DUF5916 domain-containing protein [Pyrinomonadaceae bacterium]|nr:DUF5916 domain-containing protein [Pyrinomonadaceae bacterium]